MKVVLGNWKMHGRRAEIVKFLSEVKKDPLGEGVGLALPALYLGEAAAQQSGVSLGAQAVSRFEQNGAFTGEISAAMVADLGATWTLIGHSERRQYFNEAEESLKNQGVAAYRAGLNAVLCVGEQLDERKAGEQFNCVRAQLEAFSAAWSECAGEVWIAYEPVWAIGTGLSASLEEVDEMLRFIKQTALELLKTVKNDAVCDSIRTLYGGSVNTGNAEKLLELESLGGLLVGGASLKVDDFRAICRARKN